jgi:hypothetical protein
LVEDFVLPSVRTYQKQSDHSDLQNNLSIVFRTVGLAMK